MEINSDNEFDDLTLQQYTEIPQSTIKGTANVSNTHVYRAELVELQNLPDLSILENQYYCLNLYKNGELIRNNIKRRFSDFDLLFEVLFRNYKGCIFPAFPEKGLVSYVKTKVSLTKDHGYMVQRMRMLQRFLTNLLNGDYFDIQKNDEIRKFLSENEFDLMKKAQKQSSAGVFSNSLNKILNYVKMGRQNKYKQITDRLNEDKKQFQHLYNLIRQMKDLLQQQEEQANKFLSHQFKFNKSQQYNSLVRNIQEKQSGSLYRVKQLQLKLFFLNQDYIMVLKTIQNIEQMKNNEEFYRYLQPAQSLFIHQQSSFREKKKKQLKEMTEQFIQLLNRVKSIDQSQSA